MRKTTFMVLARPCNHPFVVDASKAKEFNKKRMPKEVLEEIKKNGEALDKNNASTDIKVFSKAKKK